MDDDEQKEKERERKKERPGEMFMKYIKLDGGATCGGAQ